MKLAALSADIARTNRSVRTGAKLINGADDGRADASDGRTDGRTENVGITLPIKFHGFMFSDGETLNQFYTGG